MKNTIRHKIQFTGMVFILSLLLGFSGTDKVAGQQLIPDSLVKIVEVSAVDSAKKNADTTKASQKGKASTDEEALRPLQISEIVSIPKIIWSLIFIILGYFIIRVLIGIISSLAIRYPKYDFTIKRIIPIFRILAWIFVIYVIVIGIFNPPAATLFAFFTSIGVAVGFAAQDLLKNVLADWWLCSTNPFR